MTDDFEVDLKKYLPLREIVFNAIREAIISGKLKPGERLMENHLAEKLSVSRTPIREALRKLELEGFIVMNPRKGAVVTVINEKDMKDVLDIRAVLEGLAAVLACDNMSDNELEKLETIKTEFEEATELENIELMIKKDIELHDLILVSTKNERLVQIINNLREQIYRFRLTYLKDKKYRESIITEHKEIVSAIKQKNKSLSEKLAILHIKNQEESVIESIKTT